MVHGQTPFEISTKKSKSMEEENYVRSYKSSNLNNTQSTQEFNHFIKELLKEVPEDRMSVVEILSHPWCFQ